MSEVEGKVCAGISRLPKVSILLLHSAVFPSSHLLHIVTLRIFFLNRGLFLSCIEHLFGARYGSDHRAALLPGASGVHNTCCRLASKAGLHARATRPICLSQSKWRLESGIGRESTAEQLHYQVERWNSTAGQFPHSMRG